MAFQRLSTSILLAVTSLLVFAMALVIPETGQDLITPVLLLLSLSSAVAWCLPPLEHKQSSIDPFHPSLLFLAFYVVYFVFSAALVWLLHGYSSQWVNLGAQPRFVVNALLFLGILSIAAFSLGMNTNGDIRGSRIFRSLYRNDVLRRRELRYLLVVLLIAGGGTSIYHLSLLGEIGLDVLRYLSPSARRDLDLNLGQVVVILESMLGWAALLLMFYCMVMVQAPGRQTRLAGAVAFLILALVVTYVITGKRSAVIPLLLLPIVWRHYLVHRLSIIGAGFLFAAGMVLIGALLLVRIALPLVTQDLDFAEHIATNLGALLIFYLSEGEWATFDMIAASILRRDELLAEMGGALSAFLRYTFGTLIVFIPRAIWPDKPFYEDPGQVYFRVLTGSYEDVGFAVTAWGTSLLFFHVPGLLVGMFALGWILRRAYRLLRPWEGGPFDVFLYAVFYWMAFQFLRFGTLGFTLLLFVQTMLVGVVVALFLARRRLSVVHHLRNDQPASTLHPSR